jgi:hypothetical protein
MKRVDLLKKEHDVKVGKQCDYSEPNVLEDCIFYEEGRPVGFFIKNISGKLLQYVEIANKEFQSENVPKSEMKRSTGVNTKHYGNNSNVEQMSCIIGSIPPKPLMRRPYPSRSSVHDEPKAKTFIKAMLLACLEAEKIVKKILPKQYEFQKKCIEENVPKEFRFGNLFTSSISNYNISAPYHIDKGNLIGCINVIITKKHKAKGGDLNVPDYGVTMDSSNNSLLVYPAWKNIHGVTPIETFDETGYRNSLIFYPLKAFKKFV